MTSLVLSNSSGVWAAISFVPREDHTVFPFRYNTEAWHYIHRHLKEARDLNLNCNLWVKSNSERQNERIDRYKKICTSVCMAGH